MDGILNINKPSGPTSHDVVNEVRRTFEQKKVGHAGTLDPNATGVLLVCLGKATKVVEYLMGARKEYRARLVLGITTSSQDSAGEIESESDASFVTHEMLEGTITRFVGRIEQVPPMVSAVWHEGQRLYKLAHQGVTVERIPRSVDIYSIDMLSFEPGQRAEAEIVVTCGSGTYIRTLCADIGAALGCGGYMSALERTAVGNFRVEQSITLDDLLQAKAEGRLESHVIAVTDALPNLPVITISDEDVNRIVHGLPISADGVEPGREVQLLNMQDELIAIGVSAGGQVRPRKVLV